DLAVLQLAVVVPVRDNFADKRRPKLFQLLFVQGEAELLGDRGHRVHHRGTPGKGRILHRRVLTTCVNVDIFRSPNREGEPRSCPTRMSAFVGLSLPCWGWYLPPGFAGSSSSGWTA